MVGVDALTESVYSRIPEHISMTKLSAVANANPATATALIVS
jgi:hypothetical protein